MQRLTEAIDIEAVGGDRLPREFATGAETTDIAYEAELLAGRNLMPDSRPYYWGRILDSVGGIPTRQVATTAGRSRDEVRSV